MFLTSKRCLGTRLQTLFLVLVIIGFLYVFLAPVSYPSVADRMESLSVNRFNTVSTDGMDSPNNESNGAISKESTMVEVLVRNRPKPTKKPKDDKSKKKKNTTIPVDIERKLKKITVYGSLSHFSNVLYGRAKRAISYIQIPPAPKKLKDRAKPPQIKRLSLGYQQYSHNPNLTICNGDKQNPETKLVLFTSMFHSTSKQYLFNNTLTNYANLMPIVQPVLFICDMNTVENSGYLVARACHLGWTVLACPRRTQYGYPILNSMYFYCMHTFKKVQWFGYANADIIFTGRLATVLEFVDTTPSFADITFISSHRTNTYLEVGEQLSSLTAVEALLTRNDSALHKSGAIDYFIYHRTSPLFRSMPNYCTGRRGYDNWLLYFYIQKKLKGLDITGACPVIHIAIKGVSFQANSHASIQNESDYNMHLSTGPFWIGAGDLRCLTHSLTHVHILNASEYWWLNRTMYKTLAIKKQEEPFNFTTFSHLNITRYSKRSHLLESFKGSEKFVTIPTSKMYTTSLSSVSPEPGIKSIGVPVNKSLETHTNRSFTAHKDGSLSIATNKSFITPYSKSSLTPVANKTHPMQKRETLPASTYKSRQSIRKKVTTTTKSSLAEEYSLSYFQFPEFRTFNFNPPKPAATNNSKLVNQTKNRIPPDSVEFLFNTKGENILMIFVDSQNGSFIVHTHSQYACPVKFAKIRGNERLVLNRKPRPPSGSSIMKPSVLCMILTFTFYYLLET